MSGTIKVLPPLAPEHGMSDAGEQAEYSAEQHLEIWKVQTEWLLEHSKISFNATIQFSAAVTRGLLLINGGAIIALLTFVGNLWKATDPHSSILARQLGPSFAWYLAGVSGAVIVGMFAYISQAVFSETERKDNSPPQRGLTLRWAGWGSALISLFCFLVGSWMAMTAFAAQVN